MISLLDLRPAVFFLIKIKLELYLIKLFNERLIDIRAEYLICTIANLNDFINSLCQAHGRITCGLVLYRCWGYISSEKPLHSNELNSYFIALATENNNPLISLITFMFYFDQENGVHLKRTYKRS